MVADGVTVPVSLQSVRDMHVTAGVAHLDITISNIMMKKESSDDFDQIRLIDFGLSEVYPIGELQYVQAYPRIVPVGSKLAEIQTLL